ncbi:MAG: transporter substrate-binding domain-containing protein [Gammaproteobacteria bacterium]
MMRLFRMTLLLLAGLAAAWPAAADSPVLDRVLSSGTVRVGTSGTQPPFAVRDADGKLMGFEVDLARTLANGMGVKAELVQKPFGELMDALDKGEVDIVMSGLAITPERARKATFVGPYLLSGKSLLTRSDKLAAAEAAEELNEANLRLAALENSTSASFVRNTLPEATLIPVKEYAGAVEMLKNGQIDALVADMPVCVVTMLQNPEAGFVTLSAPLTVEPVGLAVSSRDPQFANLVETYVDALEKTGILDQIRAKWLDNPEWLSRLP